MKTSYSAIQTFKSCRRLYELKYIYGLEPVQTAEALSRGTQYHAGVEALLNEWLDYHNAAEVTSIEDPKIRAMVFAFNVYVIPKLAAMGIKPVAAEPWFTYETASGHIIVGRADGVMSGHTIIEHKTTSSSIDGAYFQRLEFDEQIPTYMTAFGCNRIFYTVCQTPTIRQKKNETDDEFFVRCTDWYLEDTESKITVVELKRTPEELDRFRKEQDDIVEEMANCKLFYRNPSHCNKWGRMCEYAPVCMNFDPDREYVQFKRRADYDKAGKIEDREADSE